MVFHKTFIKNIETYFNNLDKDWIWEIMNLSVGILIFANRKLAYYMTT